MPLSETPLEVVQQLNRFFSRNVHVTMFVTLYLAQLDLNSLTLSYCNAGHNCRWWAQLVDYSISPSNCIRRPAGGVMIVAER